MAEVYSIELLGSRADVDSLARSLEENQIRVAGSGPRYHVEPASDNNWRLPAHEVPEAVIKRLKPTLFEHAKRGSVSLLALRHESGGTMHLTSDPLDYFEKFLKYGRCPRGDGIFFVRIRDLFPGCVDCLESSKELASSVLSIKTPRIAVPLLYYALEEFGKAAILFNSAIRSQAGKSDVIIVKGFYDHARKLKEASYELLGIDIEVNEYLHERRGGHKGADL